MRLVKELGSSTSLRSMKIGIHSPAVAEMNKYLSVRAYLIALCIWILNVKTSTTRFIVVTTCKYNNNAIYVLTDLHLSETSVNLIIKQFLGKKHNCKR